MGDVTRQAQVITAPQGTTMIRPIQISDQNVITMNGATAIPAGGTSWQQVKTTGQPITMLSGLVPRPLGTSSPRFAILGGPQY